MFDIGISELGVIAVVALIVIGPERLPKVARLVGTMLGRAQRYVNDVKAEVNREIELEELKKLQADMQDAAKGIHQQVSSAGAEMQSAVHDVERGFQSSVDSVTSDVSTASATPALPPAEPSPLGPAARVLSPPGPPDAPPAVDSHPSPSGPVASGSPWPMVALPPEPLPPSPPEPPPQPPSPPAPPPQPPSPPPQPPSPPPQPPPFVHTELREPPPEPTPGEKKSIRLRSRRSSHDQDHDDRRLAMSEPEAPQETFISHLVELRTRLVRAIVAVLGVFLFVAYWTKDIYSFLARPLLAVLPAGSSMIATDVTTTFFVPVKVSMLVAFMIALPYVLYQMWAFVAPGLYQHEKRLVVPLLVSSTLLFLVGMAFAYFIVFPMAFKFFADFTPVGVTMATDIDKYFNFVLTMFIVFGIAFEVPVVEVLLVKIGAVTVKQLREIRRYVVVGIFVVAAVVTPPDVFSQLALAIPLCILYELGIILARFVGKPITEEEKKAMSDAQLERELDRAEAEEKKLK